MQVKDRAREASTLGELGNLYGDTGRLEESVTFLRQAADMYVGLQDLSNEGRARYNLAVDLIKLGQYDEARRELERAIACKEPFGHAATPWTTWALLHNLEQAAGDPQAAAQARQQAVQTYLAYRRAGGRSLNTYAQLYGFVAQAIQRGNIAEAQQDLAQSLDAGEVPSRLQIVIPKLQAILDGVCDRAPAADPDLNWYDAAELQLLLEALGS